MDGISLHIFVQLFFIPLLTPPTMDAIYIFMNNGLGPLTGETEMTNYIVLGTSDGIIYGFGDTSDDAWKMALDGAGPVEDTNGDTLVGDEAMDWIENRWRWITLTATDNLIKAIMENGGDLSWERNDHGVACLPEEVEG